jgi:hypothetical protein
VHPSLAMLHLQMQIECKGFDERGDIVQIPGPTPVGISRFKIVEYPVGVVRYFRHDNVASAALARALGVVYRFTLVGY